MTDTTRLLVTTLLCMTCPALAGQSVLYIAALVYDRRARMWRDLAADAERQLTETRSGDERVYLWRVVEGCERRAGDDEASAKALRWWRR